MTFRAMATPNISVLMSCYNASRWLSEAISSVITQTYSDFEFIIVDDGSKDETLEIVRQYADRDSRIVIVKKPNTGLADSLNVGIQQARGEWVARLDADDLCEPTRLAKQFEVARANSALVFVGTGLTIIDQHGNQLKSYRYPIGHGELLRRLVTVRGFPPHSSAFCRTKAVRAVGGYRPRIRRAQDWDLWSRLSVVGELACIDEPLVRIRKHSNQISHEDSGKRQKLDSRVAMTSYWLRQQGFPDPVDDIDIHFDLFRSWIERRLEEEAIFLAEGIRNECKEILGSTSNLLIGGVKIAGAALQHPSHVMQLVWQRIVGDNLPRHLAQEWMKEKSTPALLEKSAKQ